LFTVVLKDAKKQIEYLEKKLVKQRNHFERLVQFS